MWSFLVDLFRNADATQTIVLMDAEEVGTGRRYQVRPRRMVVAWGGTLLGAGALAAIVLAFTPLRTIIPGYNGEEVQRKAETNARRVEALQDSIATQRQYAERLRQLITGRVDTVGPSQSPAAGAPSTSIQRSLEAPSTPTPDTARRPATTDDASSPRAGLGLSVPVDPPVSDGFPTRGIEASTSHYGIDVAVSEGTYVRAIGAGRVVLADWTRDGGNTLAVQHDDGYLSVYKHNKELLKHLGDRVEAQEPVAVSGNTGEITTGPHLHFELWHNGRPEDPRSFIAGW